ncbi:MAG: sporulation membrane protein YtaF [Syntrophaceae bacterium]|nr:sporulation membrane protein YtaF [Syntrophaceae bacterium]
MADLHILTIFLLALSSNLDNIGVGTSYGARGINIPFSSNLLIAVITSAGTFLSMTIGNGISTVINPDFANAVGALLIGGTGVWVFIQELLRRDEDKGDASELLQETNFSNQSVFRKALTILDHPFLADTDFSGHISVKEGFLLAFALTLNNLTNGIGAGLLGLNITLTTAFVVVLSIVTIWFGIQFGRYSGVHWFGRFSGRISGLILIFLGIYEYFN